MNYIVKKIFLSIVCLLFVSNLFAEYRVKTIDFLAQYGLKVNAAGPLLLKMDAPRNRIVLVNTNTPSISIINSRNYSVFNIPIKNRIPQYLKSEALTINSITGHIYVIGTACLHIVFPEKGTSVSIATGEQYEMVAVNEKNGDAYLVGMESKYLVKVSFKSQKLKRIPWLKHMEELRVSNHTPAPPIRKVVVDSILQQVILIDGYNSNLFVFSALSTQLLRRRKLAVKGGSRWHMAGYNNINHHLYLVIEQADRLVTEAVKVDVIYGKDFIMNLPGLAEGSGIIYNLKQEEIYIPYDNSSSIHVVDFKEKGSFHEIKTRNYGNNASAIDESNQILYVANWSHGEIEVIDLKTRRLIRSIADVGVLPHMFTMGFNPHHGHLVIPIGATAVNGSFGASVTALDLGTEKKRIIHTGWAPTTLEEKKGEGFLVFNSEDQVAEISATGSVKTHPLPPKCSYVNNSIRHLNGTIYVSYGTHQSSWPIMYIHGAQNGVLRLDPGTMQFYNCRVPRMSQQMVIDKFGVFWALQNNWGKEKQFLISFSDDVCCPQLHQMCIELEDIVVRETSQRILKYDSQEHWLYIVRVGEKNKEPGIFQIFDLQTNRILMKYPVGLTPTDLCFNDSTIYITNFDSDRITVVDKNSFSIQTYSTGQKPLRLALLDDRLYCVNHNGNTLQAFGKKINTYRLPYEGKPDNVLPYRNELIITSHSAEALYILSFRPSQENFDLIHKEVYPFGDTSADTDNASFGVRGQFADGIFHLNRFRKDKNGKLWITDYLSGKLFIIEPH